MDISLLDHPTNEVANGNDRIQEDSDLAELELYLPSPEEVSRILKENDALRQRISWQERLLNDVQSKSNDLLAENNDHKQELLKVIKENSSLHEYISAKKAIWRDSLRKSPQEGLSIETSKSVCKYLSSPQLKKELQARGMKFPTSKSTATYNKKKAVQMLGKALTDGISNKYTESSDCQEASSSTCPEVAPTRHTGVPEISEISQAQEPQKVAEPPDIKTTLLETENKRLNKFVEEAFRDHKCQKDCNEGHVHITQSTFLEIYNNLSLIQVKRELESKSICMPNYKSTSNENKVEGRKLLKLLIYQAPDTLKESETNNVQMPDQNHTTEVKTCQTSQINGPSTETETCGITETYEVIKTTHCPTIFATDTEMRNCTHDASLNISGTDQDTSHSKSSKVNALAATSNCSNPNDKKAERSDNGQHTNDDTQKRHPQPGGPQNALNNDTDALYYEMDVINPKTPIGKSKRLLNSTCYADLPDAINTNKDPTTEIRYKPNSITNKTDEVNTSKSDNLDLTTTINMLKTSPPSQKFNEIYDYHLNNTATSGNQPLAMDANCEVVEENKSLKEIASEILRVNTSIYHLLCKRDVPEGTPESPTHSMNHGKRYQYDSDAEDEKKQPMFQTGRSKRGEVDASPHVADKGMNENQHMDSPRSSNNTGNDTNTPNGAKYNGINPQRMQWESSNASLLRDNYKRQGSGSKRALLITDSNKPFNSDKFSSHIETKRIHINSVRNLCCDEIKRKVMKEEHVHHIIIDVGNNMKFDKTNSNTLTTTMSNFVTYVSQRSSAGIVMVVPLSKKWSQQGTVQKSYMQIKNKLGNKVTVLLNNNLYDKLNDQLKPKFSDNADRTYYIRLAAIKQTLKRTREGEETKYPKRPLIFRPSHAQ